MEMWIWQKKRWPQFIWQADILLPLISKARLAQGKLLTKVSGLGFELSREASADVLTEEAMKTSEIEGEVLNRDSVRSSVAKHLGLSTVGLPEPARSVDGLVDVLVDATRNYSNPLTAERLKSWHAALFPTGYSGLFRILAGDWRMSEEPMQVVSGGIGERKFILKQFQVHQLKRKWSNFSIGGN